MIATLFLIVGIVFMALAFGWMELDIISHTHKKNRTWHVYKAFFQGFFYSSVAEALYGFTWKAVLAVVMYLAITVLVFNPIINLVRKRNDFFYISKYGIEGRFYNTPKLYYLLNLIIAVSCFYLINYKL